MKIERREMKEIRKHLIFWRLKVRVMRLRLQLSTMEEKFFQTLFHRRSICTNYMAELFRKLHRGNILKNQSGD